MNGAAIHTMVRLIPIMFMRRPPIGADRTAPRVKEEPIQLPSMSLWEVIY